MEPFLALDGLIIPNSQLDVKNFFSSPSFLFNVNGLVTYPILDEHIILELEPSCQELFSSPSFSFQCEWTSYLSHS